MFFIRKKLCYWKSVKTDFESHWKVLEFDHEEGAWTPSKWTKFDVTIRKDLFEKWLNLYLQVYLECLYFYLCLVFIIVSETNWFLQRFATDLLVKVLLPASVFNGDRLKSDTLELFYSCRAFGSCYDVLLILWVTFEPCRSSNLWRNQFKKSLYRVLLKQIQVAPPPSQTPIQRSLNISSWNTTGSEISFPRKCR